jgi:hypothetical protein
VDATGRERVAGATIGLGLLAGVLVALLMPRRRRRGVDGLGAASPRAACNLRTVKQVQKILGVDHGGKLERISPTAAAFGRYMAFQAERKLRPRDVVRAYLITVGSINRDAIKGSTLKRYWPEAPYADDARVRPEEAMADLLRTREGQDYVRAAEKGHFLAPAARVLGARFRGYGYVFPRHWDPQRLKTYLWKELQEAPVLAEKTHELERLIRVPGAQGRALWMRYLHDTALGVAYGKAGFLASILGRGDMATADARQIGLWTPEGAARGKVNPAYIETLNDKMRAMDLALPTDLRPFYEHLAHYTIWEAVGGAEVTHQAIKNCMAQSRLQARGRARVRLPT